MNYTLLFQRLRLSLFRNTLRVLMERSGIRVATIVVCSLLIWGTLFFLSWQGFHELDTRFRLPVTGQLMTPLFYLMFFALTILLLFSTGIILYGSLFQTPESAFLLSSPVPADHVFRYKFQGAVAFSSWAFVLMGSPILLAYGLEVGAPWHFYLAVPLFFLGFILVPGCLGALIILLLVNFLPNRKKQALWLVLGVSAGVLGLLAWWVISAAAGFTVGSRDWFEGIMSELSLLGAAMLPIHWISLGLKTAATDHRLDSLYYLLLLWSNGLLLWLGTLWAARRLYRRGYNRVATGGDLRRRFGGHWLDRGLERLLFFIDPQTRLLIVKDFRTFRRDPAQWFQVAIFLGLVTLYFSNVRRFYRSDIPTGFQNGISFLTLLATAFLTCAYTGRFIFPMLSLEGRKFWILGLLPLNRDRLLWGKFGFSATWCVLTSEFVVILTDVMLQMPWLIAVIHILTALVLALGLSGLSVGLGACLPNFRETDPSKIAVGFGGTLNLVAGLLFLLAVVGLTAGPFHVALAWEPERLGGPLQAPWWTWAAAALGLAIGGAGTWLPMRAGMRNLRRMEF
ncbi:MAG: hypothetical protein U0793_20975 [Gemmataceae bacterium]